MKQKINITLTIDIEIPDDKVSEMAKEWDVYNTMNSEKAMFFDAACHEVMNGGFSLWNDKWKRGEDYLASRPYIIEVTLV